MELKLFMWSGFVKNNERYTIYAIAEDLVKAKTIAIEKASGDLKEDVKKYVELTGPFIYDTPDSFIFKSGAQLI